VKRSRRVDALRFDRKKEVAALPNSDEVDFRVTMRLTEAEVVMERRERLTQSGLQRHQRDIRHQKSRSANIGTGGAVHKFRCCRPRPLKR